MRGEGSMYRDKQPTTNYEIYSHSNFEGGYNESNGTTADATALGKYFRHHISPSLRGLFGFFIFLDLVYNASQ